MQKDDLEVPPPPPRHRRAGGVVLAAALIAIAGLTLEPMPPTPPLPAFCLICGPLGGVDFILNIGLFVPVGVGIWLLGRPPRAALMAGLTLTLIIEGLQWRIIPGRDASLGDLLANATGAWVGGLMMPGLSRWLAADGARARTLSWATATISAVVAFLSAWLVVPKPPAYRQWILWTADRPNLDPFPGTLLGASVNGIAVRGGDALRPDSVFLGAARQTSVRVHLVVDGRTTRRKAHILAGANPVQDGFFLGQWKDAAIFRTYINGSRLKLRTPLFRLPGTFRSDPGPRDSLTLLATSDRRGFGLVAEGRYSANGTLRRTLSLGWTLLLPWDVPIDQDWWPANVLFLALLVFPCAFFAGRSSSDGSRLRAIIPLSLVAVAIALAPLSSGISATTGTEWTGAGLGAALGLLIGRLTSPLRRT